MTPSMRKKVLIGAGSVFGVLVVALILTPFFLDPNSFKPKIIAQVKKATGRELVIDGPVTLSLLPVPSVTVTGIQFLNAAGSRKANMVEVKSVTATPSMLALLRGDIDLAEVTLVEPKIVLEIDAEGKPNWEFAPSTGQAVPATPKSASSLPFSLGKVTVENGALIFSDTKAGVSITAENATLTASVGSVSGPYSMVGSATVNGTAIKVDVAAGPTAGDGLPASLRLEAAGGKLTFKGTLSEVGPNVKATGFASASADSLSAFVASLAGIAGQPAPAMPALLASKFSFDGAIELSQSRFAARDFKMALAGDSGAGTLAVTLKPAPAVEGKLVVPRLDLDRAFAALTGPSTPAAGGKPATASAPTTTGGASVLDTLTAKLSLEAAEVIYNKQAIRNVAIELDAKGGTIAVPKLAATLPGDMVLQARSTLSGDPAKPTVAGDFSLVGQKLRETLDWLAVDVSAVPADKLKRLSLKGRLGSNGGNVQVDDGIFELDDVKGTGGVIVTFSVPLSIETRLEIDTIDLDSFLTGPAPGQKKPTATTPAAATAKPAAPGPTLGLKLKIRRAIYNKETIGGIDVDVVMRARTLELKDVKVSNLGGARLAVRGNVVDYDAALPRSDIAFNFEAPDLSRVLKIAGATAPTEIGPVTASGGVSGTVEVMTFRELRVAAQGQSAQVDGTLVMTGAALGPPSSIGYKGKITANGQTIEGTVDVRVAARPSITADLKTTLFDLDKLGGGAPASVAPRAATRRSAAAPVSPAIDTSAMRAIDASLKLSVGTLVSAPLRLSNANIAARLKDGVLTIEHFKAGLYGGALDLSGTVNGSEPALAFEVGGDARNINLGEMLRSLSGTNQFGGAIKITVDGRLSATGISLRGGGTSREQIKASMAGGAQLGGHVFVGADKALTALGTAAVGAAGGAIDNALGSALGIAGIKGDIGIGNLLNAASLLLRRFVNRDNPVAGHLDIAGGVVSDRNLIVSGDRATANISTRTNLGTSTTDTKINFMIAEDRSAPYIVATVRGPFSRLSYNAVRGGAKDPPGAANTLTETVPNAPPSIIPGLGGGGGQRPPINIPIPNIFGR
ncbi:MAG: AsmA family protein [Enhydrobacter sp.]|nr:AsmA family protein [Enhydrobacter sp.]